MTLALSAQFLFADTLYKKKAPVAIGFGNTTAKSKIDWADCSREKKEEYVRPPYWVSKGDNCKLRAAQFGLGKSGRRYVAKTIVISSLFFPDAKPGQFIDFENDATKGVITLTYRVRSLRLPYGNLPTQDELIWDELSVAEGFANVGQMGPAGDLLQDSAEMLQEAPPAAFPADFIMDTAVSLFRIKPLSPEFSAASHASLLRLAYLRTTLEPEPVTRNATSNSGCDGISGEDAYFYGNVYRFGSASSCGLALAPKPDGRMPDRVYIGQSLVQGGTHVLDGIQWDHDTFVGSHIQYRGGKLLLNGVLFVNCIFEMMDNQNGDRVIDYVIARAPRLSIGIEAAATSPKKGIVDCAAEKLGPPKAWSAGLY